MPDRIKKEYEIELMSDLCPGSGFSYAGIIDSDVSFDTFGFPYISGKRIKGCMRETAKLLGIGNIDKLFGIGREGEYESKENNKIIVSNAVPKGIPAASELKKAIDNGYFDHEKVINLFTSMRAQTAIKRESGIADDSTLRFTRVINKSSFADGESMRFIFEVEMPSDSFINVDKVIRATRNIGMNRNRGLGSVRIRLVKDEGKKESTSEVAVHDNSSGSDRVCISYMIRNEDPLIISSEKDTISMDYIPGYSVLGAFAKEYLCNGSHTPDKKFEHLFLKGTAIFSDLNYSAITDKGKVITYYKTPSYINILKKTKKLVDTEILIQHEDELKERDKYYFKNGNQPKKLKGKRITTIDGKYLIGEVEKEIIYHHSRSSERDDENRLFFFDAISKGQLFAGKIIVDKEYKDVVLDILKRGKIRLGKSKSSQYGLCKVIDVNVYPADSLSHIIPESAEEILINFKSDAVFMDKNGNYTSDYKTVWEIIRGEIGAYKDDPGKSYVTTKTICGYSGIWNLHKQEIPAISAGSTFVFKVSDKTVLPLFLGTRQSEGFGDYEATIHSNDYKLSEYEDKKDQDPNGIISSSNAWVRAIYKECLLADIRNNAKLTGFNSKLSISVASLGRLNLMVIESRNACTNSVAAYADLINRVSSIKRDATRNEIQNYLRKLFGFFPECEKEKDENGKMKKTMIKKTREDIKKDEVVTNITKGKETKYNNLAAIVGEKPATDLVFDLWYEIVIEVLTYVKYNLKEGA